MRCKGIHTVICVLSENNVLFFPPEAESHHQEIQKLEENKENTQGNIRKNNKKEFSSYGENKAGLIAVLIHTQKS